MRTGLRLRGTFTCSIASGADEVPAALISQSRQLFHAGVFQDRQIFSHDSSIGSDLASQSTMRDISATGQRRKYCNNVVTAKSRMRLARSLRFEAL